MWLPYPAQTFGLISVACARLGERALFCSGASDFANAPHSDQVKVVDAMNHAAIFPACRAVVHQGGAGTTAAGMRAGIPTLILWHPTNDQQIWADAVTRLKVGSGRAFRESSLGSLVAAPPICWKTLAAWGAWAVRHHGRWVAPRNYMASTRMPAQVTRAAGWKIMA